MTAMNYTTYNWNPIIQGAHWSPYLLFKDDDGSAIDLSSYTAKMQIRSEPGGELYAELSTANSKITITGAEGKVEFVLTSVETAAFYFRNGVFDLQLTDTASEDHYPIEGTFTVRPAITV